MSLFLSCSDAFGVSGVEGIFSTCCQVTLKVLRDNKDVLLTVLESFIHDPLVEWTRKRTYGNEVENDEYDAIRIHNKIRERLNGIYNIKNPKISNDDSLVELPLSIEGQVYRLIKEATSDENLARSYCGWMPFL